MLGWDLSFTNARINHWHFVDMPGGRDEQVFQIRGTKVKLQSFPLQVSSFSVLWNWCIAIHTWPFHAEKSWFPPLAAGFGLRCLSFPNFPVTGKSSNRPEMPRNGFASTQRDQETLEGLYICGHCLSCRCYAAMALLWQVADAMARPQRNSPIDSCEVVFSKGAV